METNTVLLSLEDYNELRDYQIKMSKGYVEVYGNYALTYFTTKDKAIRKIAEMNKCLKEQIERRDKKIIELETPSYSGKVLKDVRKMSILQFIKWRKNG